MQNYTPLNDNEWAILESLFPKVAKRGRGKPHAAWRKVVNSILAVMLTEIKWGSVPKTEEFATKSAAHRWFLLWDKNGFLKTLLDTYRTDVRPEAELHQPPRRRIMEKTIQFDNLPLSTPQERQEVVI